MGKNNKFEFGTDFQELILQYTLTDPLGFKALPFYEDSYFDLIEHATIAYALKKYYKKHKRVPEEPYLREYLRGIYQNDKIFNVNLGKEDQQNISNIISRLYSKQVSYPEEILAKCISFARFVKFKDELEQVDISHFDSYESAIGKLTAANRIGSDIEKNYGTFLVEGMGERAHRRDLNQFVFPTPFKQMNKLLNSGGLQKGSVIVTMSKEKRFKTGFLINVSRGYLKMRKKGVYIDLENGEGGITTRTEQSISNQEQKTINSGAWDNKLLKTFRKYKRIGAELVIKRFSSLSTTCNDLQIWLDDLKRDTGFVPQFAVIDYGLILGANSNVIQTFARISESFLDMKSWAEKNNLEAVWTAAHVNREASKSRTATKYLSTDIADCIDIVKHIDGLWGLQESEDEEAAGVMRLEMIEQRNGLRQGNVLFWADIPKQRLKEFSQGEILEYRAQTGEKETGGKKPQGPRKTDMA